MKKRIGERLLDEGLIDQTQLRVALGDQRRWGGKLGSTLLKRGFVTDMDLVPVLGRHLGVRYARINGRKIPSEVIEKVGPDTARKFNVVPLGIRGRTLLVATSDPSDLKTLDAIQFAVAMNVQPVLAIEEELRSAVEEYYGTGPAVEQVLAERIPVSPMTRPSGRKSASPITTTPGSREASCAETLDALVRLLQAKGVISEAELRDIILTARSLAQRSTPGRPSN